MIWSAFLLSLSNNMSNSCNFSEAIKLITINQHISNIKMEFIIETSERLLIYLKYHKLIKI